MATSSPELLRLGDKLPPTLVSCAIQDGWRTIIESETFAKGLNEEVVRAISAMKDEPEWLLDFRLKAFK